MHGNKIALSGEWPLDSFKNVDGNKIVQLPTEIGLDRDMGRDMKRLEGTPKPQGQRLPRWKRALDLTVIFLLSPAMVLVGAAVALVVKCGSRGPIFFRQKRVGYRGTEFTLFKFRTMRVDAETRSHQDYTRQLINGDLPMTKLDARKDPRLVPLGTLLRATGLDELPQVLNVLRGEMSIVGPRPCIPYEYENYAPRHRQRLNAVPGLTGLWQVSGKNRTTFNQMVELDIEYAARTSLALDLRIILKTLPALQRQCAELREQRRKNAPLPAAPIGKSAQLNQL